VTQDAEQPKPFDEQAALAELERLADKIQITRRQRAAAVDEFDAFVRGFREDRHAAARAAEAAAPSSSSGSMPAATTTPQPREPLQNTSASLASALPTTTPRSAPRARSIVPLALAIAALIVVVVIVRSMAGRAPATPPAAAPAATAPAPQPSVSAPAPTVPAAPARAINIELTTLRPVWTRVVVDDKKTVERELAAGTKIPIGADRSVVIRAGDAGAVRLTVDGKDQGVMGKDGFPATRSFAKNQ
jgi:hypothetical protein